LHLQYQYFPRVMPPPGAWTQTPISAWLPLFRFCEITTAALYGQPHRVESSTGPTEGPNLWCNDEQSSSDIQQQVSGEKWCTRWRLNTTATQLKTWNSPNSLHMQAQRCSSPLQQIWWW